MMRWIPLVAFGLLIACGETSAPSVPKEPVADPLRLAADPGEAQSVLDAVEAEDGVEVVVVGRVKHLVQGHALFHLIDASLEYCGQVRPEDDCPTPWDYCCIPQPEQIDATVVVELVGPDGKVRDGAPAGLRLLDLVVVKGRLQRDEHDNPVIAATGWFRRERPALHDGLLWPE